MMMPCDVVARWQLRQAEVHFHFAAADDVINADGSSSGGSEHTLDGKSYPAEAHLVHYNTKCVANRAADVFSSSPSPLPNLSA